MQVRKIRQHEIDARHLGVGEHDPAVEDHEAIRLLNDRAVPPYFSESP
jgi:hypothetical protein